MEELTLLRKELLRQHAELRDLSALVATTSERARNDVLALAELRALLRQLYDGVRTHNAYEDAQLETILPGIDSWGPVRRELMVTRHRDEHMAILRAIEIATIASSAATIAESTADVLRELSTHMEREEKEFLGPDVLRDDLVTIGESG